MILDQLEQLESMVKPVSWEKLEPRDPQDPEDMQVPVERPALQEFSEFLVCQVLKERSDHVELLENREQEGVPEDPD